MFTISNNNIITMNRGDTIQFDVDINEGSRYYPQEYILQEGDNLYFGLMEYNCNFEHAILKKVYTSKDLDEEGNIIITLDSDDTVNLLPGNYFYEIKLEKLVERGKGILDENKTEVSTVVSRTKFIILE